MYCGNCGTAIKENARFCGRCGAPAPVVYVQPREPEVVYIEEKPLTPILEDKAVVALTFCVLILSILTIALSSAITKDVPPSKQLQSIGENVLNI